MSAQTDHGISKIVKRDGRVVDFDKNKITEAIWKAIKSVGGQDRAIAERLSNQVVERLEKQLKPNEIPHVEQVQDLVEQVLVENNLYKVAKAYILYRALHAQIREFVDSYLENKSWLVRENANTTYSLQALNFHISSQVISQYWLHRIFNKGRTEIRDAHLNGDFHIHNLGILGPYCVGWDLQDLLTTGFRGVRGKVSAKPAKHFRVALGQVVNFVFTLQGEAAGAQAFSSFDTYLAPFIRYDNLDYKSVKQALQEFLFNMNIPTRVGFQSLCWDEPIIIKEKGKVKAIEIGKLVDREFEKYPYRVIEKHPQSYALENHDDYQVLSFNPDGKAVWTRVKAFVRHKVPSNSEFVRIRTNRGEARVSKAHSLFGFSKFNSEFNPIPKSVEDVKIADDYRHLNEENHFIALKSLENQGKKEEIDLVEIIDELPHLQKNVFVKINPTHTLKRIRQKVILEEQSLIPFYKDFGLKDRGVWESWLEKKSIRYDVWRKYGDLDQKVEFKLKNSDIWCPRFLSGKLLENFVKLCAWYISEGHTAISTPLYISQSLSKNARSIIGLLRALNALGQVARNKGYSNKGRSTKMVLKITGRGLLAEIVGRTCGYLSFNKTIPWFIFDLSPKYQKMFIKTLLKGDGAEYQKHWDYSTTSRKLSASLSLLLSQNGFRFAVYTEKVSRNNKNWRDQFIIRIFKDSKPKKTYFVNDFEARVCLGIEKFNYDREYEYDISVDLPQENFIGGAGLLVFHNTPFSNVTLDLRVPSFMENEPVIVGGGILDDTYGDFQEEMNIFNRALAEVMLEGDAVGRVFSVDGESLCPIRNSGRIKLVKIGKYVDEWMEKRKPIYIKENGSEVLDVSDLNIETLGLKGGRVGWHKVNFLVRHPAKNLLKIFTVGGFNVKVTPSHSVMVLKEGRIQSFKASMLRKGEYLLMPRSMPSEERKSIVINLAEEFVRNGAKGIYISNPSKGGKPYKEMRKVTYRRNYGKRTYEYSCGVSVFPLENIGLSLDEFDLSKAKLGLKGSPIKLKSLLPMTEELAEFLGYYCAEGSAEKGGISLGFNLEKEKKMAAHVAQLIRKVFGDIPIHLREIKERNLIEVRIHSRLLRRVITEIFKIGTGVEKRVPQIIFEAPREMKKRFLSAYFRGDAWLTENIVVNSTSRELIYGVSTLLKQLRIFHTLIEYYRDGRSTWRISVWRNRKLGSKDSYSISKIPIKESGLEIIVEKILEKEPYYFDSLGRRYRNTKIRFFKRFGISHCNSTSLQKVREILTYARKLKVKIPSALEEIEKGDLLFLKVKKIEKTISSNGMVYDLATESENFIADQLLVHNTFPIPTINIAKDFDWDDEAVRKVLETSAKYGIPYFANFVNSDMNPEDIRSMCCHLRLDKRELKKRGGGLFGANPLTGSIGVVTINMPRIGYLSKSEGEFFERLDRMMVLAKDVLEIKRKWLEKFTEAGLYPYSRFYLRRIKEAFGSYWKNHFNTIGLIGMNEACINFLGYTIGDQEGLNFSIKVLDFMRKRLQDFQEETGSIFNLEATPAEGTSHRLAKIDKKKYPDIIVANEEDVKNGAAPYYTNSTNLPVYYTDDLWEYLRLQDPLQTRYTGGTVVHVWLGESNPPVESVTVLVRKICENFKLPYFTLTPTFSICPEDGYLSGEQPTCPKCGRNTEIYSRVVGYLRPVDQWNAGKQEEFKQRKAFDRAIGRKTVKIVG